MPLGPVLLFKAPNEDQGKDKYQETLESAGFVVDLVPVLEFVFVNLESLAEKLSSAEKYSGLVFTSKRAVEAVHKSVQENISLLEGWKTKNVYVVGPATERAVKSVLGLDSLGAESGNAENLAQFILKHCESREHKALLFPKGNLAKDTINCMLSVDDVICYETQPSQNIESHLKNSDVPKYVVLFSPSGAVTSLPVLKTVYKDQTEDIELISIGPTTEAAIVKLGFKVSKVVSKPSPEMLLETLEAALPTLI